MNINVQAQHQKTFLLLGGRAPVTLDLARALHSSGHKVIMAESQEVFLSQSSNAVSRVFQVPAPNESPKAFANSLASIINNEKVDVLLPTCEEVFHVARNLDLIPKSCLIWVDEIEKLRPLHDKGQFNQTVQKLGLSAPKSFRCESREFVGLCLAPAAPESKWVLKPAFSRFAAQTHIGTRAEILYLSSYLPVTQEQPWILQEFISGKEFCTYSLAYKGRLLAHVTYDHEFTAGKGAGISFDSLVMPELETWVATFVQKLNLTGQFAFDFILASNGKYYPLECNPRATSGLHLIAGQTDFQKALSNPESVLEVVRPPPGESGQIQLAMWIYGIASIKSFSRFILWLRTLFRAREVIFSLKDPKPFFTQFVSFYRFVVQAKKLKITPLEASTKDIEWNGSLN